MPDNVTKVVIEYEGHTLQINNAELRRFVECIDHLNPNEGFMQRLYLTVDGESQSMTANSEFKIGELGQGANPTGNYIVQIKITPNKTS